MHSQELYTFILQLQFNLHNNDCNVLTMTYFQWAKVLKLLNFNSPNGLCNWFFITGFRCFSRREPLIPFKQDINSFALQQGPIAGSVKLNPHPSRI